MVSAPSKRLDGIRDLPPPCSRQKHLLVVEIYQLAFSGPDQRVWIEDLSPVVLSIGSGGKDGVWLIVGSVSSWVPMWR